MHVSVVVFSIGDVLEAREHLVTTVNVFDMGDGRVHVGRVALLIFVSIQPDANKARHRA